MTSFDLANLPSLSVIRTERTRRAVERTREEVAKAGRLNLRKYIRLAWPILEPGRTLAIGWAMDAIADHIEAVSLGHITRLLITCPPGLTKSLTTCVFYPSYEWGPNGRPYLRFISFSYDMSLSTRDAVKCRRLMQSEWYQQLWGDRFRFTSDVNLKQRYENDQGGFRLADYVGGGTGERGDIDIVDDPHEIDEADSDAKREAGVTWVSETLPSRLVDPRSSAIIVIQQRVHEHDVAGDLIARNLGYTHLNLPMEFIPESRCSTAIGFKDPRKEKGELLFPERFPLEVVERDKLAMGNYAVAAQFQQAPVKRGGLLFKRHWFEVVEATPHDCYWVRRFDLASSKNKGSWTAGVLMGHSPGTQCFYVRDVVRERIDGDAVKRLVRQTAAIDVTQVGRGRYSIWLPQDPGQAGKVQAADFLKLLLGYDAHCELESGDKVTRAKPFAAQAEAGNVKLLKGSWNMDYLNELCSPSLNVMDQIDASSGAFGALIMNPPRRMAIGSARGMY